MHLLAASAAAQAPTFGDWMRNHGIRILVVVALAIVEALVRSSESGDPVTVEQVSATS